MVGHIRIIVIGNVGTDPEMRYSAQGTARTTFRLASSRSTNTPSGERQQETEWFTVVAWNQLAELCNQYLTKGRRAYVEGRLHSRSWDGQDGRTHFVNEIIANQVIFLDRAQASAAAEPEGQPDVDPGDLPF